MAEKMLNTRIGLKIDTLENWEKSTLGLLKGEIAIATTAASAVAGLTEPVCMIKIGEDGKKTFKDLEWNFYAKAADVLTACKTEAGLTAFVNGVIADAGLASAGDLTALTGRVTTAEGAINTLKGDANTAGSVAKAIADAIAALDLANTYEVKGEAAKVQSALDTYIGTNNIALANVKATAEAAYVKPATGIAKDDLSAEVKASLGKADTALQAADIADLATKSEVSTGLAGKVDNTAYTTKVGELETAIAGKVEKVDGKDLIATSEIERLKDVKNYDDTALAGRVTTAEGKITAAEGKITALEAASATHALKTEVEAVDAKITTLNGDEGVAGSVKTIAKAYADAVATDLESHSHAAEEISFVATEENPILSRDTVDATNVKNAINAIEMAAFEAGMDAGSALGSIENLNGELVGISDRVTANGEAIEQLQEDLGTAEGKISDLETAVEAIEKDYLKAADKTELEGKITAEETRAKGVEEGLQNQINLIMNNPDTKDVIDSISEFTQYVAAHGTIAEGFRTDIDKNKEDIAANAKAIEDLGTAAETAYETKTDAANKLTEAKGYAKDYADGLNTAMNIRVEALEGAIDDYVAADAEVLAEAKEHANGLNSTMDGRVKAIEDTYATTETVEGKIATALQAAKDYADEQDANTTYTAKADGGLKLEGTEFSIDDTLTFIFNCGGADAE